MVQSFSWIEKTLGSLQDSDGGQVSSKTTEKLGRKSTTYDDYGQPILLAVSTKDL